MLSASEAESSELAGRFRALGDWDDLDAEEAADLDSVFDTAREAKFPGALLPLPRKGAPTHYYAAARSDGNWRILRSWLVAFAGPTVSNFNGRPREPSRPGEADKFLAREGFHAVARIKPSSETTAFLRRSLLQLVRTAQRMPDMATAFAEPRHVLLRRFFNSVAAGDLERALECVGALRHGLHLDTLNLLFLEAHARGAVGDWIGVAEMREFASLLQARKPRSVNRVLLEALYTANLADPVEKGEIDGAIDLYRRLWRPLIGKLEGQPFAENADKLARLFAVDALSRGGDAPPWRDALAKRDLGGLAEPFAKAFPEKVAAPVGPPRVEQSPTAKVCAALFEATNSASLTAKRAALAQVDALGDGDKSELFSVALLRRLRDRLIADVGHGTPSDWPNWLARLVDPGFREKASDIAQNAAEEWDYEGAFADPIEFADSLRANATGDAATALSGGLPILVNWLKRDPYAPRRDWTSIYLAIVDAYSLGGEIDAAAREATLPMIELMLEAEPAAGDYRDLIDQADMLSGDDPGVHGAWWPLKVAELLRWYGCPDTDARADFLHRLLEKLRASIPRLTPSQRLAAKEVAEATAWPWPEPREEVGASGEFRLAERLGGMTVAIYTLVERAAEQARQALAALTPTTRVELCVDHVASPRLTALARNADLFVMVTWAAKHAATDAIRRERPNDKPLIMPTGKGASSLLEAIDRWAGLLHQRD